MKKFLRSDTFIGLALALVSFIVYLKTLAPSFKPEDGGELAAALGTLGIAHPTGYPLFTLLGWTFSHLPFSGSVIWKLNLMVAIFCSVSLFFFYRVFLVALGENTQSRMAAATATLLLGFSKTFWSEALSVEVHALHLLFLALVSLFFLLSIQNPGSKRYWLAFALALGLSFTNHMMTALLAPAFLYLYFASHGFGRAVWIRISGAILPFLAGLSLYAYLPIRSAQNPVMNWGSPSGLHEFWWHVSGGQYRAGMFSSSDIAFKKLNAFFAAYPSEFNYLLLAFAMLGIWDLWRRNRYILVFSGLVFLTCVFYAINYVFNDPNYYLNAYFATILWIAFGIRVLLNYFQGRNWSKAFWILCPLLILWPLYENYADENEAGNFALEDYARNLFTSLDSGAVIFSDESEVFTVPAFYLQNVEKLRPDVTVIDLRLFANHWYRAGLERNHPQLMRNSHSAIESFIPQLREFRIGRYDPEQVKGRFEDLLLSFSAKDSRMPPVYLTPEIAQDLTQKLYPVFDGLVFRLLPDNAAFSFAVREYSIRPFPKSTPYIEDIKDLYATAYANQGVFLASHGDTISGVAYLRKTLALESNFPEVREWLVRLGRNP